jgi:predicted RNA-binding protein with PUA-like domain
MPRHWLMKSEPETYSIDHLRRDGRTTWEGVRNFQARNFMRDEMQPGDPVLFYHSSADPPGVAGVARVSRVGLPDPTAMEPDSDYYDPKASEQDPRWYMVEIEYVEHFPALLPLSRIRETSGLEEMPLNRRSRLSVQPVTEDQFRIITALGRDLNQPGDSR